MSTVTIKTIDESIQTTFHVKWCDGFWNKFLGLMFKKTLQEKEGLLIVNQNESIIDASIHMFFMRFDIFVVWLNSEFEVVDMRIAKRWQPYLIPQKPAQYVLEVNNNMSDKIKIGTKFQVYYA